MQYNDSTLLTIDGVSVANPIDTYFDAEDFIFVLETEISLLFSQTPTPAFKVFARSTLNTNKTRQLDFAKDGRSMDEFLAGINAKASGLPFKVYRKLRRFTGREINSNSVLYDTNVIINDNYIENAYIQNGNTYIKATNEVTNSFYDFLVLGAQLSSAPITYDVIENVNDGVVANWTDETTTTILEYGVNIVDTVEFGNNSCKLPQPTTGRTVRVINTSANTLYVFPSNLGGQINNLPVNFAATVPPDGKIYDFICIENPLPGAWTYSAPATTQVEIAEMTISHTNGTPTNGWGDGVTITPTFGAGIDGSSNLTLSGNYLSRPSSSQAVRLKVYTNIVQADLTGTGSVNRIKGELGTAFKSGAAAASSGQRGGPEFGSTLVNGEQVVVGGTLNSPIEIGDVGTLYSIYDYNYNLTPPFAQLVQVGQGGPFSAYFFIFGMIVPASAATKDYKFKFFLEVVE